MFTPSRSFLSILIYSSLLTIAFCEDISNFPKDIPRCHFGETDCITRSTELLLNKYGHIGYPAAAFPVVEPFFLQRFDITNDRESSVNLNLSFHDMSIEGLTTVKFDGIVGFERDPTKSKFELYGSIPKITIHSKYVADGRILILPIKGDGDADIALFYSKFAVKFKPSVVVKNRKSYLMVEKLKVLVEPERMDMKLTNLFNGDAALSTNINQFLNENWHEVWNELQPSIHAAIAEICKSILRNMFTKFAYEDLYLKD